MSWMYSYITHTHPSRSNQTITYFITYFITSTRISSKFGRMSVKAEVKEKSTDDTEAYVNENRWTIRPFFLYKEEYGDCKSIKGRFHQYFIHGESVDCLQWKRDYDNCSRYEDKNDLRAAEALIQSESDRRKHRFKAHFENDTWTKRKAPPPDWNKSLPEWLEKRNENTLLEVKSRQAKGEGIDLVGERFLCTIM